MADYTMQSTFDDQFFYIQVDRVKIAFFREDIEKVIEHLESLRDEMAGCGTAS